MVTIQSISPFGKELDSFYMAQALDEARKAFAAQEVPIGAIVVAPNGEVVGRGRNRTEEFHSQTNHAELLALQSASDVLKDWRLLGCWVYVTLEPCVMCAASMMISRCSGSVYGAPSPLFGYSLDNGIKIQVYNEDSFLQVGGVLKHDSALLLKEFFKKKRKQRESN